MLTAKSVRKQIKGLATKLAEERQTMPGDHDDFDAVAIDVSVLMSVAVILEDGMGHVVHGDLVGLAQRIISQGGDAIK